MGVEVLPSLFEEELDEEPGRAAAPPTTAQAGYGAVPASHPAPSR